MYVTQTLPVTVRAGDAVTSASFDVLIAFLLHMNLIILPDIRIMIAMKNNRISTAAIPSMTSPTDLSVLPVTVPYNGPHRTNTFCLYQSDIALEFHEIRLINVINPIRIVIVNVYMLI